MSQAEARAARPVCDESFPECLQCRKAGLCCSGARTGAFFVHAFPERPLSISSAKQRLLNSKCETIFSLSGHETASPTPNPSPLSLQQPGRADIFDQLFVSHFIESFGFKTSVSDSPSPTWLDDLSVFIISPVPGVVKHSIRAGSMFFYGTLAQDVAIRTEACKWYMRALQGLQGVLSRNASPFTGDVICAAVMLTHFETLAGTSDRAWYQHVQGASMMLETGGPESCRDGFLHQLFRHLRLLTVSQNI
ncbi:hypothetical protein N7510_004673 [Penicillium lagena]|uniref:uncharacterized protein n=1 Tax=Penicillium lagena TaxID=94218 RepID=UPI002540A886|nr:uncharacterized protein N7510_004673 [Penicillium lagena]KAJ5620689.1 hypothetical protein N7510_004673 [Penicillium lagena]